MKRVALVLAAAVLAINVFAQSKTDETKHTVGIVIPDVALIGISGGKSISLAPTAPKQAGGAFDFSTANDESLKLQYSSVVNGENKRQVKVSLD